MKGKREGGERRASETRIGGWMQVEMARQRERN